MGAPSLVRTNRCLLRPWQSGDATLLREALDASLDHLHPWVPWARTEPYPLDWVRARIERRRADFESGSTYEYGVFDPSETEVLGGVGLYGRVGPDALELGYWVRKDAVGQGLAVEVAGTVTEIAFDALGVERVEAHIHVDNEASMRVAAKLGFGPRGEVGDSARLTRSPDQPEILIVERTARHRPTPSHPPGA